MKVVFWGTPTFSINCLDAIIEAGHEVVGVITQPDKRRQRGNKLIASPVKVKALEHKLKVFTTESIKNDQILEEELIKLEADIFVVIAFGQILPERILNIPRLGSWNCHASLLPRWRGAAPIQWSIIEGDSKTGVGIMLMEAGLDTGPVLIQQELEIRLLDNAFTLSKKLSLLSAELLIKALERIEKYSSFEKQELFTKLRLKDQKLHENEMTYARQLTNEDKRILWDKTSIEIHRKIMGIFPYSYAYFGDKRIKILQSEPIQYDSEDLIINGDDGNTHKIDDKSIPGEIIEWVEGIGTIVRTGSGSSLLIKEAQLEGKNKTAGEKLVQQLKLLRTDHFM